MVVKSKIESEHINDLGNIFEILRGHKLHFNAAKCSFGLPLRIDSFLDQRTSVGLSSSCCISGRDSNGQRSVPLPSKN